MNKRDLKNISKKYNIDNIDDMDNIGRHWFNYLSSEVAFRNKTLRFRKNLVSLGVFSLDEYSDQLEESGINKHSQKIKNLRNSLVHDTFEEWGIEYFQGVNLITTENDNVGIVWEEITPNFEKVIEQSDVIIAKGMGYFECLFEEQTLNKPIIHLFRTKCYTVANSLNVELRRNVALFLK